jgi:hypothetical protein
LGIPEATDNTIGGSPVLDLHHAGSLAGHVWLVEAFRDHAVETAADCLKPAEHDLFLGSGGGEADCL